MKPLALLFTTLMLAGTALLTVGTASAQPPRCWTNDQGVTECGTRPPPGVDSRTVRTPRPASDATATDDADEDGAPQRDPLEGLDPQTRQELMIQQRQCELAREVLRTYEGADHLYDTDDEGNRIEISAEQREAILAEARDAVTQLCEARN